MIAVLILSYSCEPKLAAEAIIEKSLEKAHGGKATWEAVQRLVYKKTTTLYDAEKNKESEITKTFYNTLQPTFTSSMLWTEAGVEKRVVYDGNEIDVFENEVAITDTTIIAKAFEEIKAAQFVLWQPYKLLTDDVVLTNEGIVRLEDKMPAYKIKAVYPNSDTIWWFYFDTTTFLLKENLIQHSPTTYSQIVNMEQEEKTGLRLHKKRKSYKVDVAKDTKYLRAEYTYTIIDVKY
ncbi:hypothetical protein C8N46_106267 [Kordia periserrulae]|uniref:Outer membrane lipoprotein-sorting protein n=1 Tax=Kordia periserrulae TaxID=701523 RepID=A0A2T6BX13_9FLAO|nr:hypothetical protein C8N46_106267 [Kordia periserrulae]